MLSLTKCNNVIKYGKKILHPTYIFSKNLTNSIHRDKNNNSRSFALFFRDNNNSNMGLTWFLFPFYGIAIECSRNTLISWDGCTQYHCSCTVEKNIYSFFTSSMKRVNQQSITNIKLNRKQKRNTRELNEGNNVYVRSGKSIQLATATFINCKNEIDSETKELHFVYKAKHKKYGPFKADLNNVIHVSEIN